MLHVLLHYIEKKTYINKVFIIRVNEKTTILMAFSIFELVLMAFAERLVEMSIHIFDVEDNKDFGHIVIGMLVNIIAEFINFLAATKILIMENFLDEATKILIMKNGEQN